MGRRFNHSSVKPNLSSLLHWPTVMLHDPQTVHAIEMTAAHRPDYMRWSQEVTHQPVFVLSAKPLIVLASWDPEMTFLVEIRTHSSVEIWVCTQHFPGGSLRAFFLMYLQCWISEVFRSSHSKCYTKFVDQERTRDVGHLKINGANPLILLQLSLTLLIGHFFRIA